MAVSGTTEKRDRGQARLRRTAQFEDGTTVEIDAVLWAIGYRDELGWIDILGATDEQGSLIHEGGVSPVKGLYFIGRPWQRNRASALIMGIGNDAGTILDKVALAQGTPSASGPNSAA